MNNIFEYKHTCNNVTFRYAKGKSLKEGIETHPYYEILYYMKGDTIFLSEQFEEKLNEGTLLIIPKGRYHKFHIANQESYTRLVFNFPDIPQFEELFKETVNEIKIISYPGGDIVNLINKICRILKENNSDNSQSFLLYAAFHMLIAEINTLSAQAAAPKSRESNQLITKCIQYIDKNFTRDISAQGIAKEMNVSPSTLFLCFKKHLGISVYKYITEKRLIYAYTLLSQNESPTKIYSQCGYNDYPTFYKAYLKMFGHPPSHNNTRNSNRVGRS